MNAAASRGPVVFAYGFRTFFLLAAIFAAVAMPVWVAMRRAILAGPESWPAGAWHGHEILFGYVAAVIAGFLLTASPNWTGAGPIKGARLAGLAGLWLAGRVAMALSDTLPPALVAAVDVAFLPVLALSILPSLVAARQPRNLVFVPILLCLAATNLVVHGEMLAWWDDGASAALVVTLDIVVLLIAAIGGRIVPSFTQAALQRAGQELEIAAKPWLDGLALGTLLLLAIIDAAVPWSMAAGIVALVAAIAHGWRLARWKSRYTRGQSILWVLHLGYAALVAGLLLKGLAALDVVPVDVALHALTVGAVGLMTLGVMSRVALGHTGRPLVVHRLVTVAYLLMAAAALVRVVVPWVEAGAITVVVDVSGTLWSAAYVLFLVIYAPMLTRARADGKPG